MTLSTLVFVYILGGVTFLPLLLAAVLLPSWLLLPKVEEEVGERKRGDAYLENEKDGHTREQEAKDKQAYAASTTPDNGAAGTFAVLRRYDFPAANAVLTAKSNAGGVASGVPAADGNTETAGTSSESVYQSMYRSVFDRSKTNASSSSLMESQAEGSDGVSGRARKRTSATPATVFYIALRHGHLMLYDSAAQVEVRHVISLAHHAVSLSEGHDEGEEPMRDGDLFIKRTAIVLTPIDLPNGQLQSRNTTSKAFYLFSSTCIEKEDFYHAVLYSKTNPPVPEPLDPDTLIKLQSTLHSTSLTPETRAFNALVSRIFLALHHTDRLKTLVRRKVEKKISRVQKPAFIASLAVQEIDLGDAAPVLSNPRLKDLNISGDMTLAFDVRYTGGIKITISAVAKLDLGPRFKARTADLVLASSLQRLHGHMLVRVKPAPSNRLWFCFDSMPDMDIKVEPVVSSRQITYGFILKAIEDRIRAVVNETLVKPNWDDITFFGTREQKVRGGIWQDEGGVSAEGESGQKAAEVPGRRNEKTMSMPVLPSDKDAAKVAETSSGTSSGSETTSKPLTTDIGVSLSSANVTTSGMKRRSIAAPPARSGAVPLPGSPGDRTPPLPSRPLRSPSFASPSASAPSVALDESFANVEPTRADDAPLQQKKWRMRSLPQQAPGRREAVEAMREMRDRSLIDRDVDEPAGTAPSAVDELAADDGEAVERRSFDTVAVLDPSAASTGSGQATPPRRTDSSRSTASTVSSATTRSQQNQQRKATILAATAAATTAARNWSWNAINNRTKGSPAGGGVGPAPAEKQQQGPMGRGQPLPPPGVPLPGPQKGLFGAGRLTGFGSGSVRRKPVPPPRKSTMEVQTAGEPDAEVIDGGVGGGRSEEHVVGEFEDGEEASGEQGGEGLEDVDEFGPWRQNSGVETDGGRESDEGPVDNGEATVDDVRGGMDDSLASESKSARQELGEEYDGDSEGKKMVNEKKVPPPLPARKPTGMATYVS